MTTLIEVRGGGGELLGRCDARCYNAQHPSCDCVCGGRNHGVGLERALENTRQMAEAMIAEYASRRGLAHYQAQVHSAVTQPPLPLFEMLALERVK